MKLRLLTPIPVIAVFFSVIGFMAPGEMDKDELLMRLLMQSLESNHYENLSVNDDFSKQVHALYIERLDYNKRFFTTQDLKKMDEYREQIDDNIQEGSFDFFSLSVELLDNRIKQAKGFYESILAEPFDFTIDEKIETDPEKFEFASNDQELRERWRQNLKYQVLSKLHSLMKDQEKNEDPVEDKASGFEELEAKAREKVLKTHEDWFNRLEKLDWADRRATYMNAIANIFDPHTEYYPPKDKENFDIGMSGQLEGIGATLQEKDGYIKVVRVVPGSPAWKQGDLKSGHFILKVAQGDKEPVDVVDMRLDKAVKLIRGKKGTEVRLTIKDLDGIIKVVPIIRDVVKLEETYAKSAILNSDKMGMKVGYIKLPKFYADFSRRGGRDCSDDVEKELEKLSAENVDGVVLDLRNNGGGSLQDVVEMAGLFIPEGPIVQIKGRFGAPLILKDQDPRIQYDGPLVILVNSFSASASEIMAAAMQDYGRAVIIGSESTFGKGTVQRFYDLDRMVNGYREAKPLGAVKLTTQKFYRINGGATQLKGVVPDIILPDNFSEIEVGEKETDFPMPWDEIASVKYKSWKGLGNNMDKVVSKSKKRVSSNEVFNKVTRNAQRLKTNRDQSVFSLQWDNFNEYRAKKEEEAKAFKDILQENDDITPAAPQADMATIMGDSIKTASMEEWHKNLRKDAYVYEAIGVLKDIK